MQKLIWEDQFLASVPAFVEAGMPEQRALGLLKDYIRLAHATGLPRVLDFSLGLEADASPYVERDREIHDLMLAIFEPLLSRFTLVGRENFLRIIPLLNTSGVTIVANHLSHFDAAVIYALLHREPSLAEYASQMFFIAGRLVFTSDFSRVAGRMFHTMLVASPKDMAENESLKRELTRLNIRSFKEGKERQRNGQALVLYPEGTRSRDGKLQQFHAGLFNYIDGTTVLPVALTGPEKILPSEGFTFGLTQGQMVIGEPMVVDAEKYPKETRKQDAMDSIARALAAMLPESMRGHYA